MHSKYWPAVHTDSRKLYLRDDYSPYTCVLTCDSSLKHTQSHKCIAILSDSVLAFQVSSGSLLLYLEHTSGLNGSQS